MKRVCAIQALSVDAAFARKLEAGRFHGRVHSVFDKAVNLELGSGGLFTLACRELDDAPNTARLDIAGFDTSGIAVDDPVDGSGDRLRVGQRAAVLLAAASPWEARLPTFPAAGGSLPTQLPLARLHLGRHGEAGGMVAPGGDESGFALELGAVLRDRAALLFDALSQARFACARRHALSMLGLGPGLTPSGDDFLVGLFAVFNIDGSPCQGWLGGGTDVLTGAGRSTNAISLAALTQAADGRVRESVATLIEALMHGTPESLVEPLRRVLAIGSSSGADLVAGILSGLELNLRAGASRPCQ